MPFVNRGVYQRLRFCSQTATQNYILADVTAVCYPLLIYTLSGKKDL